MGATTGTPGVAGDGPVASRPDMPGYGIAPAAAGGGLLPWAWAEERLAGARNYWVATGGPDGTPHLAAVWAVWLDGALWFSTGGGSRKARNLAADPRCSVAPEGAAASVVVRGVAGATTDAATVDRVLAGYVREHGSGFPDPGANPVFAVRPRTVIAVIEDEAEFTGRATRWTFPGSGAGRD